MDKRLEKMAMDRASKRTEQFDRYVRPADAEERINAACRRALNGDAGKDLMAYLREITIHTILEPTATDAELRHHEGMRQLYGILERRRNTQPKGD